MKELTVEMIKELLDEKLSGFNTGNIRNQSTAKEIITIENTVMKKGITEVNKLHDLFHIKFNVDGVDCIVLRTTAGHLCGYIKTEIEFEGDDYQGADEIFNAIGGITFVHSGYVGFDCAHYDQMGPLREHSTDGRYLPLIEVIGMTIDLASQEKKLRDGGKKEPSATFDELIDVAVKAYKDGVLPDMELDESGLSSSQVMCCISAYKENIEKAINDIQALYKETFTIESEEDVNRVNKTAKIKLSNGIDLWVKESNGGSFINVCEIGSVISNSLNFISLKGATITQKKGGK